jgi:hypothetical protein
MSAALKLHPAYTQVMSAAVLAMKGLNVVVRGATTAELETIRATLEQLPRSHVAQVPEVVVGDTAGRGPSVALTHSALEGRRLCGALMRAVAEVAARVFHLTLGVSPDDLGRVPGVGVWDRFSVAYGRYHQNREQLRQCDPVAFATLERVLRREVLMKGMSR